MKIENSTCIKCGDKKTPLHTNMVCGNCHEATHKPTWYETSTGNHQGLIIDEKTGENIAVVYDKKYAPLIVTAVNDYDRLHERIEELEEATFDHQFLKRSHERLMMSVIKVRDGMREALQNPGHEYMANAYYHLNGAISEAEGK